MNVEKEKRAIAYLKSFEPEEEPYFLCYSGGKDSDCIRILAALAGVKHDIVNNHTTVDAPETVRYIRSIPNVGVDYPKLSMWELIVKKKYPPTRLARYCCSEFKERRGVGKVKITGVRWAESLRRKESADFVRVIGKPKAMQKLADDIGAEYRVTKAGGLVMNTDNSESRRFVESCYRTTSAMINPIVDWTDEDVWEFLHHYGCESNPLYQCGFKRIGCIGCPLGGGKSMKHEFSVYPKYRKLYVRAFDRMLAARKEAGLTNDVSWRTGEDVMRWWVGDNPLQTSLFDGFEEGSEIL